MQCGVLVVAIGALPHTTLGGIEGEEAGRALEGSPADSVGIGIGYDWECGARLQAAA